MEEQLKVYDEDGNLLEEYDEELGLLELRKKVIKEHPEVPETQTEYHYELETFYFTDGTSLTVESQDDPHVKIIDPNLGIFEYVDQGENKEVMGSNLKQVTDVEYQPAQPAWTEYEDYYVYIPYTEEQLEGMRIERELQEKRERLLNTGADRLDRAEENITTNANNIEDMVLNVEDLTVFIAEMIGTE